MFLLPSPELLLLARAGGCGSILSSSMLTLLELSRGLLIESATEPPGGVLGREDTEGDLGGTAVGLNLVRKRRACAASLFTSVSNSTACTHGTPQFQAATTCLQQGWR